MNKYLPLVIALILIIRCSSTHPRGTHLNLLEANNLKPVGRFLFKKNNQLELIGTAVHFGFRFSGNNCTIIASIPIMVVAICNMNWMGFIRRE